jgi:DNA polymerase/3'-5' exonuclease PolX
MSAAAVTTSTSSHPTGGDRRPEIIAEFETLRKLAATESAGAFKVRSYVAAIKAIQALPGPVTSIMDLPPPAKGDGLSAKMREKIEQILTTGSLSISPETRARATALHAFQQIYGVGPKKAADLVTAGYTTVAALRTAATANPKLLNRNQHTGLRYYEQLLERIPRTEMDAHAALLMGHKPAALEGIIVGSYRRGRPDSGDIDMLLRVPAETDDAAAALRAYVTSLQAAGYIREVLAHGDHKCMAIAALPGADGVGRRLDLLITPPAEFPFAVFYFTGSDTFNVAVRSHALTMGLTLNEHALTQVSTGRPITGIKTERDIFGILRLAWVEPPDRTGPGAVRPIAKEKTL